jgi:hypothetical protein
MPKLGLGLGVSYIERGIVSVLKADPPAIIWTFATPAAGRTIIAFSVSTTSGTIQINWGDDTSNIINSDALVNKTY